MQVTLKQIAYFMAAAECGQFSAAANKVHVTQTAITAAIRELESALGVSLFVRHHASGVSLTVDGQKFLQHAYNISAAVNSAVNDPGLLRQKVAGKVLVGATPVVLSLNMMIASMARFTRAYPHIEVEIKEMERPALEAALRHGEVDVGAAGLINFEEPDALSMVGLTRSRRQLWLPASHPLLTKRSIALRDVTPLPFVVYNSDETARNAMLFWKAAGLSPNIRYSVSNIESVRSLVAQGLAVTILADATYRPFSSEGLRIETRPLADALPFIEIGLAWNNRVPLSPAADTFKNFMDLVFGGAMSVLPTY